MNLTLSPGRVALALCAVACSLLLVQVVIYIGDYHVGALHFPALERRFHIDEEGTAPAYFSTFLLAASAAMLALIGWAERGRRIAWWPLAAIFAFLAIDEALFVHEGLMKMLRSAFDASGVFYFAWVVPYGVVAGAVALAYARFMFRLPRRYALLFIAAGGLFLTGGIGFEMAAAPSAEASGIGSQAVALLAIPEEGLEMFGVVLFLYALMSYAAMQLAGLRISVAAKTMPAPGPRSAGAAPPHGAPAGIQPASRAGRRGLKIPIEGAADGR